LAQPEEVAGVEGEQPLGLGLEGSLGDQGIVNGSAHKVQLFQPLQHRTVVGCAQGYGLEAPEVFLDLDLRGLHLHR